MAEPTDETNQIHQDLVKWTRVVGVATVGLVLANAVMLYLIWGQWQTAADAQKDTRQQLRSVITLSQWTEVRFAGTGSQSPGYGFVEAFQNVGGSRTDHFSGFLSVKYFEGGVPNNLDLTRPGDQIDITPSVIGPNSVATIGVSMSPKDAEEFSDKNNNGVALLWGKLEYSDIFDPKVIHTIQVCYTVGRPFPSPDQSPNVQSVPVQGSQGSGPPLPLTPYRADCNKIT
jgi:hypothetical protein